MHAGWIVAAVLSFPVVEPAERNILSVSAADGTALHVAEYRYQPEPRPTVLLIGDRAQGTRSRSMDNMAQQLFHRGLDVVLWDKRGTGSSEGVYDLGHSDPDDLTTVINAIAGRSAAPLGVAGFGTGGVAVFQGPHRSPHVQAIAVYGVGNRGVPWEGEGLLASLVSPHSFLGRLWMRLHGVRLDEGGLESGPHTVAELEPAVAGMRRIPMFFVAPGASDRVSPEEMRLLYDAAGRPKQWLLAPQAGDDPPAFSIGRELADFFRGRLH